MSVPNDKELGKFIRRVRKFRKLKQTDLAKAIGVSSQYVCDLEKGRRGIRMKPEMALTIAEYLNVPLNELLKHHIDLAPIKNKDKLNEIYRAVRHKHRAKRIMLSLEGLVEVMDELKEEVKSKRVIPRAENAINRGAGLLKDLQTAFLVG